MAPVLPLRHNETSSILLKSLLQLKYMFQKNKTNPRTRGKQIFHPARLHSVCRGIWPPLPLWGGCQEPETSRLSISNCFDFVIL